jgi:uncharacterized protein (DUF1330 family)
MPAYMIVTREGPVRDAEQMAEYQRLNRKNPPKIPIKPLAIYGMLEPLEGDAPDGALLHEFASVADAKARYYSPEYQAALPHRQKAADYRMFIVEGL